MSYPIRKKSVEAEYARKHMVCDVETYTLSQKELQNIEKLYPTRPIKMPITRDLSYKEMRKSIGMQRVEEGAKQGFSDVEISEHYKMNLAVVRRFLTMLRRSEEAI